MISIDSSTSVTGWAKFENGNFVESGVIDLNTYQHKKIYKNNLDKRVEDMGLKILELLSYHQPDIIIIEKLNVGRNMVSVRALSKIIGIVYCYSIMNKCFYYEIQATQWRSKLGMQSSKVKRDEYKKLSINYVKNNFGIDVISDDESDAICAGIGYIKLFTEDDSNVSS